MRPTIYFLRKGVLSASRLAHKRATRHTLGVYKSVAYEAWVEKP